MEYDFRKIEKFWQQRWKETNAYKVDNPAPGEEKVKPKYYVLDMFPYPSGAGLHVGHPLGYIASDIYARYKRLKGFNVLHPMGYDAFGLPAEQYAIEHGIHPAISTEQNINNFRKQLESIGFSFDWDREMRTSDPMYYKWTQWIFLQLFQSFYNRKTNKAELIKNLIAVFEQEGNVSYQIPNSQFPIPVFSADEWNSFDEASKQNILMEYRLVYCGYGEVNWCEALGTVLANDEVINGVSERGGYPVTKKKLRQWYLRITEYAERLLEGLENIEFSEAMKEMQSNWIGKSTGAEINFRISGSDETLKVYTTRPDTIFGVDFMVVAPEHEILKKIVTEKHAEEVAAYIDYTKTRNERERMAEKIITGCFTGAAALNPFDLREIPVWISEYVLAGYGTGAIMAVPCSDERDFKFAKHFNIPITNIIGDKFNGEEANATKDAELENSNFLTGMLMEDAIRIMLKEIEDLGIGKRKTNYKMRDAAFSRQRYWGEPIPIVWRTARQTTENKLTAGGNGIAYPLDENELPLELPYMEEIKPAINGEGPLSNNKEWLYSPSTGGSWREASTMPGYAGSSWYFLRYMDPHNDKEFCDKRISDYWNQVDVYVGGTEHAVGHLLYSRMWTKVLYDLGYISFDEPYKKLVNQGMIQGSSRFVYRLVMKKQEGVDEDLKERITTPIFFSFKIFDKFKNGEINDEELMILVNENSGDRIFDLIPRNKVFYLDLNPIHVDVNIVDGVELNIKEFKKSKSEYANAVFILEDGKYICGTAVEKMSKSKLNTVTPIDPANPDNQDTIVVKYGADTFRMYEMFLGPVEQSKPWDTKGIEGVHRFLRKLWRLFYDEQKNLSRQGGSKIWTEEKETDAELKVLHKAIKKIEEDTECFSFNTAVSAFMICVNELTELKCSKKEILEPLLILLSPYAPHIAEELWNTLGNTNSILDVPFPKLNETYLVETTKEYPISINGRLRTTMLVASDASDKEIKKMVLENDVVKKWVNDKTIKKFIFIKGKMINVVV